jgi:hypothetical protein
MAKELSFLVPDFRSKVKDLLAACKDRSVRIELFNTLTTPMEQASLWRQGRSAAEVELKVMALEHAKALYIAQCLRDAKTNATNLVTDALPGFSWHNWAEAANCVWVDSSNKLVWARDWIDKSKQHNGYQIFAEEAVKLGLTHCAVFSNNEMNWTQVQLRDVESPDQVYSLLEIDAEMRKRYGR